jgi:ribosomal protein S18 acetylase RimI-like enzyme
MNIQKMQVKDIPGLVAMVTEEHPIGEYGYSEEVFRSLLKDKDTVFLVAIDQHPVGFLDALIDPGQNRISVKTVMVAKNERRKRVASMLLNEIETLARKQNYSRISFSVGIWNKAMNTLADKMDYAK